MLLEPTVSKPSYQELLQLKCNDLIFRTTLADPILAVSSHLLLSGRTNGAMKQSRLSTMANAGGPRFAPEQYQVASVYGPSTRTNELQNKSSLGRHYVKTRRYSRGSHIIDHAAQRVSEGQRNH